jgi:hypothetical protein
MSTIPGTTLAKVYKTTSAEQRIAVLKEVDVAMNQLDQNIESSLFNSADGTLEVLHRPSSTISDLDGNRCLKFPLINGWFDAPVHITDFIETMSATAPQPKEAMENLQSLLSRLCPVVPVNIPSLQDTQTKSNSIRFCHMDNHFKNIMVQNGRLSGIIDWEMAGWYTYALEAYSAMQHYCDCLGPIDEYVTAWDLDPALENASRQQGRLEAGGQKRRADRYRAQKARLIAARNAQSENP